MKGLSKKQLLEENHKLREENARLHQDIELLRQKMDLLIRRVFVERKAGGQPARSFLDDCGDRTGKSRRLLSGGG